MSCGVGHRRCSDLSLLWLWHRPAAVTPIRPLAWEPPYAVGAVLEKTKKKKKKRTGKLFEPSWKPLKKQAEVERRGKPEPRYVWARQLDNRSWERKLVS